MVKELTKIESLLEQLREACGYDKSESASEDFVLTLHNFAGDIVDKINASHDEGLCSHATIMLAHRLEQADMLGRYSFHNPNKGNQ